MSGAVSAISGALGFGGSGSGETPLQGFLGLPPIGDVVSGLTGQTGAEASLAGAQLQYQSGKEARDQLERLNAPYLALGERNIPQFESLLSPSGQFDYLQNNPMFNAAIRNTSRQLKNTAAAQGKFNSGGLVNELFQNYLSQGDQAISSQFNRLLQPVTIGQNAANFQGTNASNILQNQGNALAAGGIGAANAYSQGASNIAGIGSMIAGLFMSDERTKEDIKHVGVDDDGNNIYEYSYKNDEKPKYLGYMAQEVASKDPAHVVVTPNKLLAVTEKYKPVRIS